MHAIVFICYPIMAVYRRHFFRDLFRCAPNEIKCNAHIAVAEKFIDDERRFDVDRHR